MKSDKRISKDDLTLLVNKDLDHNSSFWVFALGALVGFLVYGLGNIVSLGPRVASPEAISAYAIVGISFGGITVFLYVINWNRVSRRLLRHYLEARDEIERRTQPTPQLESDKMTSSEIKASKEPKFDKDIELLKISLVSEEIRTRFYTALGAYFSLMIAIAVAELGFGIQIGAVVYIGLIIILLFVARLTFREIKQYKQRFSRFEPLIKNIENGKTNGDLNEILKALRE